MAFITKKFKSESEEWTTPDSIFVPLNDEFHFTIDVAGSKDNAKCPNYYSKEDDALTKEWRGICWLNPPYGPNLPKWIKKAWDEAKKGATVVMLLPARTNTNYWHNYCFKGEVRFIRGYPKFNNAVQGLKFPLAVVIFRPKDKKS